MKGLLVLTFCTQPTVLYSTVSRATDAHQIACVNDGEPAVVFSLSAGAPRYAAAVVLKWQRSTLCAKTQRRQFSTTGRRRRLTHTRGEEQLNAAQLAETNGGVSIHCLRDARRVHKGRMERVCPPKCLILTHCVSLPADMSLDNALPHWEDDKAILPHLWRVGHVSHPGTLQHPFPHFRPHLTHQPKKQAPFRTSCLYSHVCIKCDH